MTTALTRSLAWTMFGLTALTAISRVLLAIVDPMSSDGSAAAHVPGGGLPVAAYEAVVLIALAGIGSLVAARHPRNLIGWIMCLTPLSLGVLILCSHAYWALRFNDVGSDDTVAIVAWLGNWPWVPGLIPMITLFPLLFPTGRPLTARWRPVAWLAVLGFILVLFSELFRPGRLQEFPAVDNPFGTSLATGFIVHISDAMWLTTTVASMASIVIRFRRARGDERQQIKWVALAAVMFVVLFVLASLIQAQLGLEDLGFAVMLSGFLFIASAVAIAMLRYRLYDIDVVINRTLVYGSLTAMLAGTYLGSVLLLQLLLERVTSGSGLAVAASTLATAALVRPARSRIQAVVDRRFFRRKYDAAQTLQRFSARVRDEVDLDELTAELRAVVAETMQPEHVTLWTPEAASD